MNKKYNNKHQESDDLENGNPFSMSVGDLMASLLFVFVLLLSGALLQIFEKNKAIDNVIDNYDKAKMAIVVGIESEFGSDFNRWGADMSDSTLSVCFQREEMMFETNSSVLKNEYTSVLNEFFPRYISFLLSDSIINFVEEIRIEGHTDTTGMYLHNMELSQDRARNVLSYCFSLANLEQKDWMLKHCTANGLSYSKPIYFPHTNHIDLQRSRRVEFKVVPKAEEQINIIKHYLDILSEH